MYIRIVNKGNLYGLIGEGDQVITFRKNGEGDILGWTIINYTKNLYSGELNGLQRLIGVKLPEPE